MTRLRSASFQACSRPRRLIAERGDKAVEIARRAARIARDKRNHALGRKYALVAAYITEQSKTAQLSVNAPRLGGACSLVVKKVSHFGLEPLIHMSLRSVIMRLACRGRSSRFPELLNLCWISATILCSHCSALCALTRACCISASSWAMRCSAARSWSDVLCAIPRARWVVSSALAAARRIASKAVLPALSTESLPPCGNASTSDVDSRLFMDPPHPLLRHRSGETAKGAMLKIDCLPRTSPSNRTQSNRAT